MLTRRELWNDIKELVLEEYRGSTNFLAFLRAVIEIVVQQLEDASVGLQGIADITEASGEWLDVLGKIIGAERSPGESDDDYRDRLLVYSRIHNAGTPDNIIDNARVFSGDPAPQYLDEAPATFFVYTGPCYEGGEWIEGGHQLYKKQVQQMAPAGVLGLVGCGIGLADGSVLGTQKDTENERKIVLAVGDDSTVERDVVLSDNNSNVIATQNGTAVKAIIKGSTYVKKTSVIYNGKNVDAVRIKDLPDSTTNDDYLVKDSEEGGTTKVNEKDVGLKIKQGGTNTLVFYRGKTED